MKNLNLFFALATCIFMYSCGTTDSNAPTFCSEAGDVAIVDEVEAMAGSTLTLNQTVCDNEALGTANWDLHSAEGHAHEGEEEEGFVLFSGSWDYDFSDELTGTSETSGIMTEIPNDVRGVWDIVISLVDAEGNVADDVITALHIENDFIPEYDSLQVNDVNPADWTGEPVWSPGSIIIIEGTLTDSDGIAHWGYHLEHEDTGDDIAHDDGDAADLIDGSFTWTIDIPSDATAGEYHFHMHAHDMLDNAMETGFHVEIE